MMLSEALLLLDTQEGCRASIPQINHPQFDRLVGFRINQGEMYLHGPLDALDAILRAARLYHSEHGEPPAE